MRFLRRKKKPYYRVTVCIEEPSPGMLKRLQSPTPWPWTFETWRLLSEALPDERMVILIQALNANEIDRTTKTIQKSSALGSSMVME